MLYKQTKPLRNLEEQSFKSNERIDRRNFDVPAFVAANGLELVGANYFLVRGLNTLLSLPSLGYD